MLNTVVEQIPNYSGQIKLTQVTSKQLLVSCIHVYYMYILYICIYMYIYHWHNTKELYITLNYLVSVRVTTAFTQCGTF